MPIPAESPSLLRRLKAAARPLLHTPLHPQWLAARDGARLERWLAAQPPGTRVLDVGCASQWARAHLPASCEYVGLDYPETSAAYAAHPQVHGDAHALPFPAASADALLLVDVLEHLRDPERALREAHRVLRPGGRLILSVPFLYPRHDAPHDYTRWTEDGHRALASRSGFDVAELHYRGEAVETATLLFNIGVTHSALAALRERRPAALLLPLVPPAVLAMNLAGWLLARLFGRNSLMPRVYQAQWVRRAGAEGALFNRGSAPSF